MKGTCPLEGIEVLDRYFLENRAKLLDLAAFLDRIDRSQSPAAAQEDPRYSATLEALRVLTEPGPDRARRVQVVFSDPTEVPIASAAGMKGAKGAWMGGEGR